MSYVSLKFRIALMVFAGCAGVALLLLWDTRKHAFDLAVEEQALQEAIYLDILADLGEHALANGRNDSLQHFLSHLADASFVAAAFVCNRDGIVVAATDPGSLGRPLPKHGHSAGARWEERGITLPERGDSGSVHLHFTTHRMQKAHDDVTARGIRIALLALIASTILAVIASRALCRRLESVRSIAGEIAEGNLALRCPVEGSDEVAQLAAAFNVMAASIQARFDAEKERESLLRESEEKYHCLYREAALGIFHSTLDGRFIDVNPALARMLGYDSPEEVLASITNIAEQVYAEPPVFDEVARDSLASGGRLTRENHYRRRDGSTWWGLLHLRTIMDASGHPLYREGFVQDVSARRKAHEKIMTLLREASEERARLTALFSSMEDEVWFVDTHRRFTMANPAALKEFQLAADQAVEVEALARSLEVYLPDGSPRPPEEAWPLRALAGEAVHHQEEVVRTPARGELRYRQVNSAPVRDASGLIVGAVSVVRDVTELKRAEDSLRALNTELVRSNSELEAFGYSISHDLQEPLRMVTTFAGLLADRHGQQLDKDGRDFLNFMLAGAERMRLMINDLLAYSRVTTRGSPFKPVPLAEALDDALQNLAPAREESAAEVVHDALPSVRGDRSQLAQLFQNLVGNAVKFRRPGEPPRVTITARREAPESSFWTVAVRDNGIGIGPKHFDRIFAVFQKLHGTEEYPGSGVGLAICRKIVERHGGRIWVESTPGEGSTFFFTLPAAS